MSPILKLLAFLSGLAPLGLYLYWLEAQALGPNPVEELTHASGQWTVYFLGLTLAIHPLRWIPVLSPLIHLRRLCGLYAFFYGLLHLATWVWLDQFFDTESMVRELGEKRYLLAGAAGLGAMFPLALTSTRGWIKRLTARRWRLLHRLVYISAIAGVVHYFWLVKSNYNRPLVYAIVLAALLAARLKPRAAKTT